MQQRIMIAMALSCNPALLIADEPTTSVDVTVQAQLLEVINNLRTQFGTAVIIITHNLGVVARYADSVNVMYAGRLMETGPTDAIYNEPKHPYTVGLIASVPRLDLPRRRNLSVIEGLPPNLARLSKNMCPFSPRCRLAIAKCREQRPELEVAGKDHLSACFRMNEVRQLVEARMMAQTDGTLVNVENLKMYFPVLAGVMRRRSQTLKAVDDISFYIKKGETLGLVGESGCGKTTTGRCIFQLYKITSGKINFEGTDLTKLKGEPLEKCAETCN